MIDSNLLLPRVLKYTYGVILNSYLFCLFGIPRLLHVKISELILAKIPNDVLLIEDRIFLDL